MSWFYQWPTGWSFLLFTVIIVVPAMIGLLLFKQTGFTNVICGEHNTIVGIFVAIVSVFLGVILSFVIINVWNNYNTAQINALKEAQAIYLLYGVVELLPDTDITQQFIVFYLKYIIDVEYPAVKRGTMSSTGAEFVELLRLSVYSYVPQTTQQTVLYTESINWLNQAITLRIDRLNSAVSGVYMVIWWIAIIDSALLIILSWFVNCRGLVHYLLVFIIAVYVATSLFLILILSYPFEGYSGLTPDPFLNALSLIESP